MNWWNKCAIYFCSLAFLWLIPSFIPAFQSSGQASLFFRLWPDMPVTSQAAAKAKLSPAPAPTGGKWNMTRWVQAQKGVTLAQAFGVSKGTIHYPKLTAVLPGQVSNAQSKSQKSPATSGPVPKGTLQAFAQKLLSANGWGGQFAALNNIIVRESGWNPLITNPGSGAYGIPQALPGSKMASAGADWRTNGETQLKWMMRYIRSRYGTPNNAWAFWQANGWY